MGLLRASKARAGALFVAGAVVLAACSGRGGSGGGSSTPTTAGSSGATSREVSFTVDGTTTYGTLEVPAHLSGRKLAAALLIAGSGPTDRNGNQPPQDMPDTLEMIGKALAGQGIVSLRFDK